MEPVIEDNDLPFEEEVVKNPYNVKGWCQYLDYKESSGASFRAVNYIYERALKYLPGSYKIWMRYLSERMRQLRASDKCITDPAYTAVTNGFERALVYLHKMPRVWLTFLELLMEQKFVTRTREAFDRALKSLPVLQHPRIWELYLKFARYGAPPESARRIFRRYLKIEPDQLERYITFLIECGELGEACQLLVQALNRENFVSQQGQTRHDMWEQLCEIMSQNPEKMGDLRVDAIIRSGIRNFSDETGKLWCALADFYIRGANFEKARDIYEEGIASVTTVRDFAQIFDAYAEYEESMAAAQMESTSAPDTTTTPAELEIMGLDLDLRLARLEDLMSRRPLLVSSVVLRQNPHAVVEWHKRVKLMEKKGPAAVVQTYSEAVRTVDPQKATGKPHTLWTAFARYYVKHGDMDNARAVFTKATKVPYKSVDDLGSVWCDWAETELNLKHFDKVLEILKQATMIPRSVRGKRVDYYDTKLTVQERVHKHIKLWSFYVDVMEGLGSFEQTRALYDHIFELHVVTPQIVINYAMMLEEHKYFEESFRVYEKGVNIFSYPYVKDIWIAYLTKFFARYGGTKLERARDMCEQAVANVPPEFAKQLFLMYGKLEEEHGLSRNAMAVYHRACTTVPDAERFDMYNFYIARARELFGVTQTREIYEEAIAELGDDQAKLMCLRFADLERQLGEIDRARGVLVHGSQFANPATDGEYWTAWHDFEVRHGNEDTFKEMLRVKRSVQASFSMRMNYMADKEAAIRQGAEQAGDAMADLEQTAMEPTQGMMFTPAKDTVAPVADSKEAQAAAIAANPEAIALDDVDEDEVMEEAAPVQEVEQLAVPAAVFGDAMLKLEEEKKAKEEAEAAAPMGAMARLRAKK